MTKIINKHCLGVWDRPMVFYPLRTLLMAGIEDVLIITGKEHVGTMVETLGSGKDFGIEFTYKVQDEASGIAKALYLAKDFVRTEGHFLTILGDNIFENQINFEPLEAGEAKIFLKEVPDPERFGVAEIGTNRLVRRIIEKPKQRISNLAVVGVYIYDSSVFPIIEKLKPSPPPRSEYEITSVNNTYIERGKLKYSIIKGFWSDMGTSTSLLLSANFVKSNQDKFSLKT